MIDDSQLIPRLMADGLIDHDRLQEGLDLARKRGGTLYDTILEHELVEEREVIRIASDLLNVPQVILSEVEIDEEMVQILPVEMARRNQSLPLEMVEEGESKVLRLAMTDPIDVMAMDEVSTELGVNIRPVLVGPSDLAAALRRLYEEGDEQEGPILVDMMDGRNPEDSWVALFSGEDEEEGLADSSVISQEMKDRPPTGVFELVEDDLDELDELDEFDLEEVSGTGLREAVNLDEWDLDDAFSPDQFADGASFSLDELDLDKNEQTRMGLGMRGTDLFVDLGSTDEEEEKEEAGEAGELDDESLQSIEMALELGGDEDAEEEEEEEDGGDGGLWPQEAETRERRVVDFFGDDSMLPAVTPAKSVKIEEVDQEKEAAQSRMRAALNQVASGKKTRKRGTLGRIAVKRVKASTVTQKDQKEGEKADEKQSAQTQERPAPVLKEPKTREISATDIASLAFGFGQSEGGLGESTEAGGEDVEELAEQMRNMSRTQESIAYTLVEIPESVDTHELVTELIHLLIRKGLVVPEEIDRILRDLE